MIDRRELLARARERGLPLPMMEKDYVLGWALYGLRKLPYLVFKGGTALAKVYFPEAWRLSEDLDVVTTADQWSRAQAGVPAALTQAAKRSGIEFMIKNLHANPGYLQFKVQYLGPLSRNWIKVDVTPEAPLARIALRSLSRTYSDYPSFRVRVECLEEILSEKLRALLERKKVRDYYDVWRLSQMGAQPRRVIPLFRRKLEVRGIAWPGPYDFFPAHLEQALRGYWENELGRLVHPVPDMRRVLSELRASLRALV